MRIWTSVIGQRLEDASNTRSMLLCDALLKRGHDVTMWTSAYDHIHKRWRGQLDEAEDGVWTMENGLKVRFMKGCGYTRNIGFRRIYDHWLCGRDLLRQAKDLPSPDAVVASNPDHLTASALTRHARLCGAAAIVDVRDKWPDIFIDYAPGFALKTAARLGLLFERRRAAAALREADAVVGMMREMVDWGLEKAGRPAGENDKVFYLTSAEKNFGDARPPQIDPESGAAKAIAATRGRVVFSFTGTFNRSQHPSLLLDAIDVLKARRDPALDKAAFIIGGDGVDADKVRERAARHEHVETTGWLKSDEMRAVLRASDCGMLLFNFPTPAFNNKTFSYLSSGLPIINCTIGELADLIDTENAGVNIASGDPEGLAFAISRLTMDETARLAMRDNVRALYDRSFDQENNYEAYAAHVMRLAEAHKG